MIKPEILFLIRRVFFLFLKRSEEVGTKTIPTRTGRRRWNSQCETILEALSKLTGYTNGMSGGGGIRTHETIAGQSLANSCLGPLDYASSWIYKRGLLLPITLKYFFTSWLLYSQTRFVANRVILGCNPISVKTENTKSISGFELLAKAAF